MTKNSPADLDESQAFEQEAAGHQVGLIGEFADFLLHNKKWWLTPIILVLLLFGAIAVLSSSSVAPFIYTTF